MNKPETSLQQVAKVTAFLSLGFAVVVSLLMVVNYLQIQTVDPLNDPVIETLIERLDQHPEDEALREQVRRMDLLSRKAYFTTLWQYRMGAYMLLISMVLLLISTKLYLRYKAKDYAPGTAHTLKSLFLLHSKQRQWILAAFFLLAVTSFSVAWLSHPYYSDFSGKPLTERTNETEQPAGDDAQVAAISSDTSTSEEQVPDTEESTEKIAEESKTEEEAPTEEEAQPAPSFPTLDALRRNHPGFRGPDGLGISYSKNVPTQWDGVSGQNIKWKVPVKLPGYNSPVLWGDKLFIAGSDGTTKKVFCYNRLRGELLWEANADGIPGSPASPPKVTDDTGYSAPTVYTDGERVYVIFATGDIAGFDMQGNRLWGRNLGLPDNHYAHSSSLYAHREKIFVQYDHRASQTLFALDVMNGETIWETERPGNISWASPILVRKENRVEIVLANDPYVAAYDTEKGEELWRKDCLSGEIGPSPAYARGIVFAANEYATLAALREGEMVWEDNWFLPDVSSPVAYGDYLYIATSYGDLACYHIADGELLWDHEFDNGFYSSPMVVDGKLYLMDRNGIMRILALGSEFRIIAEPELGERSDCTPAYADGHIYIRGKEHLYCIGE